jgi:nicotinate-nucleotide adenylyltransferase
MPHNAQLDARGGGPLGILGGTFDPVHFGHLRLAEEARRALGLAEVRWVPAGLPAHRAPPQASALRRLAMVRLAILGNPAFSLDDGEAQSAAPSYSVPTLERLRGQIGPQRPLVLLLGADAFLGLCTWHRWRELFGLAHLAVATRPNYALAGESMDAALADEFRLRQSSSATAIAATPAGRIVPFGITALDISATGLRAEIAAGGSPRYLLPDPVLDYIATNRLYNPRD